VLHLSLPPSHPSLQKHSHSRVNYFSLNLSPTFSLSLSLGHCCVPEYCKKCVDDSLSVSYALGNSLPLALAFSWKIKQKEAASLHTICVMIQFPLIHTQLDSSIKSTHVYTHFHRYTVSHRQPSLVCISSWPHTHTRTHTHTHAHLTHTP